jgi:hypothetical protein
MYEMYELIMEKALHDAAQTHQLYILNGKKPQRCLNNIEWVEWMSNTPLPTERTNLNNNRVLITSFAGFAGDRMEGQPLTFCTWFKPESQLPEFVVALEWYRSWDEAKERHHYYVELFTRKIVALRNSFRRW